MYINKIRLINWQKHSDLTLDFNSDLNVISGLTGTGKSCLRRAIDWLCFNSNISESDFRKEGTKETSVTLWLDNDCEIERVRSASINRYILRKNSEEKVFDSIGKSIPDEIKEVLGVDLITIDKDSLNLNIANQITLPFLLDKPASFRAKLFNKLTGNEVLDSTFKQLNKESLSINRQIKETEENLEKQENELADYSIKYKELKKKYSLVKTKFQDIQENVKIYEQMLDLANKIKTNKENQEFVSFKISKIKLIAKNKISELKEKAETLKKYNNFLCEIESINDNLNQIEEQKKQIKIVDVNFDKLKKKNEILIKGEQLFYNIEQINQKQQESLQKTKQIKEIIASKEKELKEVWSKQKVCPLCKRGLQNE